MKVILLQDVARVGRRSDIADVPDGHALNFLIPRGMVAPATPENLKKHEAQQSKLAAQRAVTQEDIKHTCEQLQETTITITRAANEQGHLFEQVKADDIARCVHETIGGSIEAAHIILPKPIKGVGEYEVSVEAGEHQCTFMLVVAAM